MSSLERELLSQASSLRALARALVGADDADDIVQEAALRALRTPPQRSGGLAAYLATIVRRLASTHHRSECRRRRREQLVPGPDPGARPDHAVARGEMLQRLAAALMALPQPYRDALLQRYFADRRPSEIAADSGVPLATVKTRLRRGLALLREGLEGDLESGWRPALIAAVGLRPSWTASMGVLLMGTSAKLVGGAAIAVVAIALALAWPGWSRTASPTVESAPSGVALAHTDALEDPGMSPADSDRRAAVRSPGPDPASAVVKVRGRCTDARTGLPLPGCAAELRVVNEDRSEVREPAPSQTTDREGRFEFVLAPARGDRARIGIRADGRLRREADLGQLQSGRDLDLGEIALQVGARLHGRIVDENGRPVEGVHLSVDGLPIPFRGRATGRRVRTTAGGDGTFVFDDPIPVGVWSLDAGRAGWMLVSPMAVVVALGDDDVELVVRCAATPSITGMVLDETGRPLAGVTVSGRGHDGRFPATKTSSDGTFEIFATTATSPPERLEVRRAEGYIVPPPTGPIAWGTRDVRMVLRRGLPLDLVVVEFGSTNAVEEYSVLVAGEGGSSAAREWPTAHCVGGRRTLAGVHTGRQHVFVVPSDEMLVPRKVTVTPEEVVRPVRIELERMKPLEVVVRSADGTPVVGADVALLHLGAIASQEDRARRLATEPLWGVSDLSTTMVSFIYSQAVSDAEGHASVGIPGMDRNIGVRASCAGFSSRTVRQPVLGLDGRLHVTLDRSATLHGRVDVTGYPRGRVRLLIDLQDGRPSTELDMQADGSFVADDLSPGAHVVHLGIALTGSVWPLDPPLAEVDLASGGSRELVVDGSRFDAAALAGRIIVGGRRLAGTKVMINYELARGGRRIGGGIGPFYTDSDGAFGADGLLPGACSLQIVVEESGRSVRLQHEEPLSLVSGTNVERDFHFVGASGIRVGS